MVGILPKYNTVTCQLQSMSGSLLGTYQLQSKQISGILPTTKGQLLCQVSYQEMLGTYL